MFQKEKMYKEGKNHQWKKTVCNGKHVDRSIEIAIIMKYVSNLRGIYSNLNKKVLQLGEGVVLALQGRKIKDVVAW